MPMSILIDPEYAKLVETAGTAIVRRQVPVLPPPEDEVTITTVLSIDPEEELALLRSRFFALTNMLERAKLAGIGSIPVRLLEMTLDPEI